MKTVSSLTPQPSPSPTQPLFLRGIQGPTGVGAQIKQVQGGKLN